MSYINEALKKAQELKDSANGGYCDIPVAGNSINRGLRARIILYSASTVILGLLLFSGYIWFRSSQGQEETVTIADYRVSAFPSASSPDKKELYDRAVLLYNEGRLTEAKKLYEAAVTLDPGYVEALNNLGIIYIRERAFASAEESLKKAVRLNPSYVEAYYNLACLYAIKGDIEQGLDHLERAVSMDSAVREWATGDSDLQPLRASEKFESIVGVHP